MPGEQCVVVDTSCAVIMHSSTFAVSVRAVCPEFSISDECLRKVKRVSPPPVLNWPNIERSAFYSIGVHKKGLLLLCSACQVFNIWVLPRHTHHRWTIESRNMAGM